MVYVYFGNLTVTQFEKKTGVTLTDKDREILENYRMDSANDPLIGRLHIFEMPFQIDCGDDIFEEVLAILKKYDYSHSIPFGVQQLNYSKNPQ